MKWLKNVKSFSFRRWLRWVTNYYQITKQISADEAEITLINKNDYHYEATWLHEASAGTISYEDVLYPVESVINKNKVNFIKAEVTKLIAMLKSRN